MANDFVYRENHSLRTKKIPILFCTSMDLSVLAHLQINLHHASFAACIMHNLPLKYTGGVCNAYNFLNFVLL